MGMAFGGVNGEFYATTFSHSSPQVEGGHGRVAGVAPGPVVGRRAVTPAIGVTAGAGRARAAVAAAEVLTERGDPGESGHIFQPKQCSLRVLGVKRKRVPWEAFLPSIASSRPCIIHQILCSSLSLSLSLSLCVSLNEVVTVYSNPSLSVCHAATADLKTIITTADTTANTGATAECTRTTREAPHFCKVR